jgi:hypothetical protein
MLTEELILEVELSTQPTRVAIEVMVALFFQGMASITFFLGIFKFIFETGPEGPELED